MIDLNNICYQCGNFNLQANLNIQKGEKVVVIGPSGAGKSTLLSLIAGFMLPCSGEIILDQQNMTTKSPAYRLITMLFQDNNLFSHLTVFQNIALGIKPNLKPSSTEKKQVDTMLEKVGLAGFGKRYPDEMSGGQKQRVALARCLIQHKPILLLDEPFSALDQALRFEMLALIDQICAEYQLTLMMVSHYLDKSLNNFNRCIVVSDGKIVYNQSPSNLMLAENLTIQSLLGLA